MRKTAKKIGSLTLALSLLVTQAAVHPSTIYAEEVPGIAVSANKNVDVALAVGNTSVDYSAFEEQLKEEIGNQMPGSNINIMAATSVDTATSSDFDWMQFDHSLSNGGAANDFIEPTGSQEGTDYDKLDRHIDLDTTSGTKLTFRGYGASGYSDFMLLENNQTTNKTFQFDIKEYFAADALYAMGFFFNSDLTYDTSAFTGANAIYDAYHADKLYLNGYLLAMEYNGQSTYGMYIYKVTNLPLYSYHNNNINIGGYASSYNTAYFTQIASLNANQSGGSYKSTDDLRKFRVEVTPSTVQVYYAGFDDETHNVVEVQQSEANSSQNFDVNSKGYQAFAAQKYEDLAPLSFTLKSSRVSTTVSLDTKSGGSDFGPMTKFGSHSCQRLTRVELSNLTMATDVVRPLNDVIREPQWNEDAAKILVNLNEEPIKDFEDEETTGELINRLQNEDIYYVGWCSDDNKEESQEFLLKNDLKGILVNVDDSDTDTLSEQIGKIADTVVERYQEESGIQMDGDAVVVNKGSDVVLTVSGASASNTADEEYPDGKWIVQSYDTTGTLISTTTTSNLSPDFTNAGKYLIYYKVADSVHLVKTIVINDAPDASFQVAVASQGAISASLTNTSTDAEGGTLTSVWKYLEVASGGAFTVLPQDASQNAVLTPMEQGKLYLVALTVTDVWGVSSTVSQQVSYDVTQSALPIADFSLSTHKIVRNATGEAISGSNLIQVKDKSYDIYGRSITSSFSCATGAGFTIDPATGTNGTYTIDTTSLSAGTYAVYLTANNGVNTSNRVARFFTIVVDQEGPTVTASPKAGAITEGNADVQISFLDEGSGFLKAKALVTTSNTAPTEEAWNALPYQYNNTYTTSFANQEGTYYIHYLVVDKLGNKTISYVGPYEVDLIAPTVAKIVSPVKGDKQVAVAPVIEWNMSESVKKGEGYLYIRRASDDAVVYTVAAASNTVRISGNVVRVNPLVTLDNNETYYVSLTKGFVKDASDNPLAALDGKESWSFTTKKAQDEVKANEIQIVGVTVTQKLFDGAGGTQTTQTKAQPGVGANTFLVYVYDTSTSDATIQVNVAPEYSVTPRNTELSVNTGNANINYTQNKDGSYDITVPASVSATDKTVTFTVKGETYTISFVSLGAKWQKVSSKVVKYGAWATGDWISADKINLENAVDISDVADNSHDVVVNVELVANTDLSAISSTDMAALTASIGGNLKFLDLTMVKSVTTDSGTPVETQIHNTLVPIKVTLTLPESLQGGYDIGVYRLHDGVIAKLGASLSEDSKQVSFESDAYSTYAIQYTEQSGGTTNVKNTDVEIPISYETTNPKDLSVPLETGKSLKKIVWNGTMLSSDFYEISKGELTLKKEAVDGMADGTYPLVVMYTDNTSFTYTLEVVAYDKTKTVTDVPVFHLVKNMSEGNRFSFTFTGVKSNASVSYASSNSKVISVTSDGTITAVKNGMATVTATIAQKGSLYQVKLKVKVQDGMPFNRTVSKDAAVTVSTSLPVFNIYKRVSLGNKTKIRLEQVAEDAVVTYTSDNTGVASVSKSGVIKGIGAGNCIVSVKIRQNDKTYCYKILVITE